MSETASNSSTEDRQPTRDPAEDNAYFPSPYSLGQYTAPTTDFDGLSTDATYPGDRWKILVIATEERYMPMQNGTFFSTGNHPVETLLPLHHMAKAGYGIDVATIGGGVGKFEWWAYPGEDRAVGETWEATREKFKAPHKLADVISEGLDDYAAIFIPGGHGAMNGIPESRDVRDALDFFIAENRLIITLCHGPAALLTLSLDRETNPLAGREIVAFPDTIDAGANVEIGYLPGTMPWALGEALTRDGFVITNSQMSGTTTRDGNLLTGDSPLAAHQLGKDSVAALLQEFGE
ncbi:MULTISPECIES: glyoxalase III HchA [Micrococcales]|uniref:glyoxalase III HchA n=1 Tax=Micrococcales TaxID=85006 RepID=UPI0004AA3207|nr:MULTISPECIES: glyoxalase III HchA [Micrococcales]